MISAVLLAGYQNKREVKKYSKMVAEHYGETFIETGYKPLREFKVIEDGEKVSKPIIQFILERLFRLNVIEEVVIVGHQMLLEQRLGGFLKNIDKPFRIINQNLRLSEDILRNYNIMPGQVKHNSIAGNFIKGYTETKASKEKKHALFVASDSPLTSDDFILNFISLANNHIENSAIIVPAIMIDGKEDKFGRKPLRLINDSSYQTSGYKDPNGRQGFRLSSLLMANPNQFDMNSVNTAYDIRKFLNPKIQIRLFRITRGLGFSNVYSKYFIKKDLSVSDCEKITSAFFRGELTIIPIEEENASYDYDGTEREYWLISQMLAERKQI
jgi:hypothetical protein